MLQVSPAGHWGLVPPGTQWPLLLHISPLPQVDPPATQSA
jgi:hypothetical protein